MDEIIGLALHTNEILDLTERRRMEVDFVYRGVLWAIIADWREDGTYTVDLVWWGVGCSDGVDGVSIEDKIGPWLWPTFHSWVAPQSHDDVVALVQELVNDPETIKRLIDEKGQEYITKVETAVREWKAKSA